MEPLKMLLNKLLQYKGPEVRIMEVCGTHTHENFRLGIRSLLPPGIRLISGPGCPVCVTPSGFIDSAVEAAKRKGVIVCTFGDLLRVPGSAREDGEPVSLAAMRTRGADIRMVYSPMDALRTAAESPDRQVVFLSVGFETTVPGLCLAVKRAMRQGVRNFSALTSNRTMTNAYRMLNGSADAFLYPGHVSAITGMEVYRELVKEGISGAVAGFTAAEILSAIVSILEHLKTGGAFACNCYPRVVAEEGNVPAKRLIREVMDVCDARWRGLGVIQGSGLRLRKEFSDFDAAKKLEIPELEGTENPLCRCGDVLRGACRPDECPNFGTLCRPQTPIGSCMVSSEGTCSAYYLYGGTV